MTSEMETFTEIIRELESERNQAFNENKHLHTEVYRLTQDMKQMNHRLEHTMREAAEMKQYYVDTQRLQEVVKKKEEKYLELSNIVNYLKEDKAKLDAQLKTERSDLRDAEKEIYRLRLLMDERELATNAMQEKLYAMKEIESQNQHLAKQLSEAKNNLHTAQIHEKTLRQQLSNIDKLEAELMDRNRLVVQMEEELKVGRRGKENIMKAMRDMQKDMEMACMNQEKAEMEVEVLKKKIENLTDELTIKHGENSAMRQNVTQIRRDLTSYKNTSTDEIMKSFRVVKLRAPEVPSGDQRSAVTNRSPLTRRTWTALAEPSDNPSILYNRSKLRNSYMSSTGNQESNHLKDAANAHPILSKYTATKFRPSLLDRTTASLRRDFDERRDMTTESMRRTFEARRDVDQ